MAFPVQGVDRGAVVGTGNGLGRGFCVTGQASFRTPGTSGGRSIRGVEGGPQCRASSVSSYPSAPSPSIGERKLFHTRECFKVGED